MLSEWKWKIIISSQSLWQVMMLRNDLVVGVSYIENSESQNQYQHRLEVAQHLNKDNDIIKTKKSNVTCSCSCSMPQRQENKRMNNYLISKRRSLPQHYIVGNIHTQRKHTGHPCTQQQQQQQQKQQQHAQVSQTFIVTTINCFYIFICLTPALGHT